MKTFIATILTILSLTVFGVVIVKAITLKQNCTGYLKRAADANTVEMAGKQLDIAVVYLEEKISQVVIRLLYGKHLMKILNFGTII